MKVDNIPYGVRSDELREVFGKYGEIKDIFVPFGRDGRPRGFAFVR